MNGNEEVATATVGISLGGSVGILQFLGILPDDIPQGAEISVEFLLSNDLNPSDPEWRRFLDAITPDEIGAVLQVSGGNGFGLGGHLAATATLYPNLSPEEVVSPGDVTVSAFAYGGGALTVFDENGELTAMGFMLGAGVGVEASLSVESHALTIDFEELTIKTIVNGSVKAYSPKSFGKCFLPHTPILLADGTTKPIAAIRPGDTVLSPDKTGTLVPARVTRTFVNDVAHVLDFHGTGVTPGHAFLCGAGRFQGRHVPLLDILRDDGAVVRQDGSLMRASTGCAVGSDGDRRIEVMAADGATGWVRAGTRPPEGAGAVTAGTLVALAVVHCKATPVARRSRAPSGPSSKSFTGGTTTARSRGQSMCKRRAALA